jgi:hypothetical protein
VARNSPSKNDPERGALDEELSGVDPRFAERPAGNRQARARAIRTTGKRIVDGHAEAMELLADHDPKEDV